jgi:hypothetical protein
MEKIRDLIKSIMQSEEKFLYYSLKLILKIKIFLNAFILFSLNLVLLNF